DLREACILAEERSLTNPCAPGDCPDCHASKSSDALLLRCTFAQMLRCTFAQMPRSVKTAPAVLTDRVPAERLN
ncbi:MAG: hypothetical protein KIH06_01570, partial [Kiritimatiellae bacterium]|nr:hypothetical protein [Kiritimatiellia bacterium]